MQVNVEPGKCRIVFVDDEEMILRALRRNLRRNLSDGWEFEFFTSAEAALDSLADRPADVLVSDLQMPTVGGLELLTRVRESYPDCVRVILSGTVSDMVTQALPVAHQLILKPVPPDALTSLIERACAMRGLLSGRFREAATGLESLPSPPSVYRQLMAILSNPKSRIDDVGELIQTDPAISARLMQLASSAIYTLGQPVRTPTEAVRRLGLNTVKALTLAIGVFDEFSADVPKGFDPEFMQTHSFATGRLVHALLPRHKDAMAAGLLHDIGWLVLASHLADRFAEIHAHSQEHQIGLSAAEHALAGPGHSAVGSYLLGIWGLSLSVVTAAANHHRPSQVAPVHRPLVGAVHVADAILRERSGENADWDVEYLAESEYADRLDEIRELAAEV